MRRLTALVLFLWLSQSAAAQTYQWAHAWGSSIGSAAATAIAPVGFEAVVGGTFTGTVNFGAGNVVARGGDGFVARYTSGTSAPTWFYQVGGAGAVTSVTGVAIDGSGNVYVAGSFTSTITFSGGSLTSAGSSDGFVIKLNSGGAFQWAIKIGAGGTDVIYGIAFDGGSHLMVTGVFAGTVAFGSTNLTSTSASAFTARAATTDGAFTWAIAIGGTRWAGGLGVASSTSITVSVGQFSGGVDLGGGTVTSAGSTDAYLVAYAPADGSYLWSRAMGSTGADTATAVALDASGNAVVTGTFYNSVDFGGGALVGTSGWPSVFVGKYAVADGSWMFANAYVPVGTGASPAAVAVDGSGHIALTGSTTGTIDFGCGSLGGALADIWIADLTSTATCIWSKRFVAGFSDGGLGIATYSDGSVAVAGHFDSSVDFGGGALSPGFGNAFVAKYALAGATPTATPCVGACDGGLNVTVDDLLKMVNAALGNVEISRCAAGDANRDGQITTDEILVAVSNALYGCGTKPPTPMRTPFPTPAPVAAAPALC